MNFLLLLASLMALVVMPLGAFGSLQPRQRLPAPPPCKRMSPAPSEAETKARFDKFVQAFVGPKKNISEAFTYIAADYIVSLHFGAVFFSPEVNLIESQPDG